MRLRHTLLTALCAVVLPLSAAAQELTVSAAASLTNAFKEIAPLFEKQHPGTTVRLNFGASGSLLQQITQGAPADVFASADQANMNRAAEAKLIDPATRRDFVRNTLVLIVPGQGGAAIQSLNDLNGAAIQRIAVGKPQSVPAGNYTRQSLTSAGLWDGLQPRIVPADNVRQVLDYVSRGEVDAGFVYRTDAALMKDKVKIVLTAEGHDPVTYPIAVIQNSRQPALAKSFLDFLNTDGAQAVLDRYGFGKP